MVNQAIFIDANGIFDESLYQLPQNWIACQKLN